MIPFFLDTCIILRKGLTWENYNERVERLFGLNPSMKTISGTDSIKIYTSERVLLEVDDTISRREDLVLKLRKWWLSSKPLNEFRLPAMSTINDKKFIGRLVDKIEVEKMNDERINDFFKMYKGGVNLAKKVIGKPFESVDCDFRYYQLQEKIQKIIRQEDYQKDSKILVDACVHGLNFDGGLIFVTADDPLTARNRKEEIKKAVLESLKKQSLIIMNLSQIRLD